MLVFAEGQQPQGYVSASSTFSEADHGKCSALADTILEDIHSRPGTIGGAECIPLPRHHPASDET